MHLPGWIVLAVTIGTRNALGIEPNAVEIEIANLTRNHPAQARATMVYAPTLNLVARAKAFDLARRGYFAHVDPEGYGPNKSAELAGFGLPPFWGTARDANYIESIAGGYASAQAAFDGWMASDGHKRHLLAETEFYAGQTRYGVGFASVPGSPYQRYYVFISTPPDEAGGRPLEPYTEWLFNWLTPKTIDTTEDSDDADSDGIPRLTEFALQLDPQTRQSLPPATFNQQTGRLEWRLPLRSDLGTVSAVVEHSEDLISWTTTEVHEANGIFAIDTQGRTGFMRLKVGRQE